MFGKKGRKHGNNDHKYKNEEKKNERKNKNIMRFVFGVCVLCANFNDRSVFLFCSGERKKKNISFECEFVVVVFYLFNFHRSTYTYVFLTEFFWRRREREKDLEAKWYGCFEYI